jgi:glycosyltransferase involved in cell wall biosynthesis
MGEKLSDSQTLAWGRPAVQQGPIRAWLRRGPPSAVGARGDAFFVHGALLHDAGAVDQLEVRVEGAPQRLLATAMPSPELARELEEPAAGNAIFWGVVGLDAGASGTSAALALAGRAPSGGFELELDAVARAGGVGTGPAAGTEPAVAICMATHEPPAELFERQIESLVGQTDGDWICLISDDASDDAAFGRIERATAGDSRFFVSRSQQRLGSYGNFGRAMAMAPAGATYVALSDQDDVWHPDKLARMTETLAGTDARLAFSDMRVTGAQGAVVSDTYWTTRRPNHASFASLLLGNSVTGAASVFRRDLLDDALPLPPHFGNLFHDHWLALVAAATGRIEYVDRPLYDYVQHADAVIGHAGANRGVVGGSFPRRLAALRGRPPGRLRGEWRRIYFGEYCRMALTAVALERRFGDRLSAAERRTLRLALAADSPTPLAWLTTRQLRRLRRDDTGGSEAAMLRGLAWSRAIRRRGGDPLDDADLPAEMLTEF